MVMEFVLLVSSQKRYEKRLRKAEVVLNFQIWQMLVILTSANNHPNLCLSPCHAIPLADALARARISIVLSDSDSETNVLHTLSEREI